MRKPIAGETLYKLNIGNAARRGVEQLLTPVVVEKVGRLYFYLKRDSWKEYKVSIETWTESTDFSASFQIYENEQAWKDEQESDVIKRRLSDLFSRCSQIELTLQQLKEIENIIKG